MLNSGNGQKNRHGLLSGKILQLQLTYTRVAVEKMPPNCLTARCKYFLYRDLGETRTLTFELSPPILYELGLSQAIIWLIDQFREKHGLNIELIDDGLDKPFNNNTRFFLFQAIRELLINIVKHAKATKATIIMSRDNGKFRIVIMDNGTGFSEPTVNYNGYGLFNIRERMNHINGQFEIKSIPGQGTRVTLVAPLMFDKNSSERS